MSNKCNCASILPSSCVPYVGKDLKFLTEEEQISCNATMTDVVEEISSAIFDIEKAIDVSDYNVSCLTGLPATPTLVDISKAQTTKICGLESQLNAVISQVNNLEIADELIQIDLGCLTAGAAPCQVASNTYTLISILTLLKNEICAIKSYLAI